MATRVERRQQASTSVPAFVGREDLLAKVTEALEYGPALVLIEGEPGIGKTRLVREVLRSESIAGCRVLVTACPPIREPFPLGPVLDGIRRLCQHSMGAERSDRGPSFSSLGPSDVGLGNLGPGHLGLSKLCGALRPLFPEWADDLPAALEPLDDPKETRHRLLRALSELVEHLGVELLVVEDAHWADTATLVWLLSVISVADPTMSVVTTYRPTDVPDDSMLRGLTSRRPAGMTQLRVELKPLELEQTRQLVGSMFGAEEVLESFAVFLHEHTDGVPLAVEESVRLLRDRHDIVRHEGLWTRRRLGELEVPPTVRDSVLERMARLPSEARRILEAAAVLANPADEDLLVEVAGMAEAEGDNGLAVALTSGLIREIGPDRYAFRHVLDAQAVGEAIPASRRRRLHGRAAAALRAIKPEPVVRLATHAREAGDLEAWCGYAEQAADLALESGDGRGATATFLDLLTAMDHHVGRRTRLARKLGSAAMRAPLDLGTRVVDVLGEVLADRDVPAVVRGEIRFQLGRLLLPLSEIEAAFGQFVAALPDLEDRPELAAGAMLYLALPLTTEWPAAKHLAWLHRAMELLARIESPSDRVSFKIRYAVGLLLLGEESGWAAAREIPEWAETDRERREIASGLLNVAQCAAMWGHDEAAWSWLAAADALIAATGSLRSRDTARGARAHLNWRAGEWEGMDALVAAVDSEYAPPTNLLEARYLQGLLDLAHGARRPAEQRLREALAGLDQRRHVEPFWFPSAALARISLVEGSPADALDVTDPAVEVITRKGVWVWATDIAPVHVEALVGTGSVAQAEALVGQFAADLEGRDAPAPAASLVVCRAIVARAQGDHTRAAELFAEAAAAWAGLPRPYDELLALERQGLVLLAAGQPVLGLDVLTDAERRLRELGAGWDADRVARLLREHGVEVSRAWKRGPKGYGDQLSPREREVLALVARGMTNREAGEALFLSPRTVGRHLYSAMRKLGVSSRTAAAMALVEAGLISPDQ